MLAETEGAKDDHRRTVVVPIGLVLLAGLACPTWGGPSNFFGHDRPIGLRILDFHAMGTHKSLGRFLTIAPAVIGLVTLVTAAASIPRVVRGGVVAAMAMAFWLTVSICMERTEDDFGWPWGMRGSRPPEMMAMKMICFLGWAALLAGAHTRRRAPESMAAYVVGALGALVFLIASFLPVVPQWNLLPHVTRSSLVSCVFNTIQDDAANRGQLWALANTWHACTLVFVMGLLAAAGLSLLNIPGRKWATVPLARTVVWLAVLGPFFLIAGDTVIRFAACDTWLAIPAALLDFVKRCLVFVLPYLLLPLGAAELLLGIVRRAAPASVAVGPQQVERKNHRADGN